MAVIFLNGTTSAGKTSIAKELQAILPIPHLVYGIDDGFAMLPGRLHNDRDGFFFDTDPNGAVRLNHGATGMKTLLAHAAAAQAIAEISDIILDEVVLEDMLRRDWFDRLQNIATFWVGVRCGQAELCRREKARGDRVIGQALGQLDLVHRDMRYDLEVYTTDTPPTQAAEQIAAAYFGWRKGQSLS